MKLKEDFLPIPSLNNEYEVNSQGVVRNAKDKYILQPKIVVQRNKKTYSRSINSLLWEVHGIRREGSHVPNIPVSVEKDGEKYFFQSQVECSKFLKKFVYYSELTIQSYLTKGYENISGWKIKRFDEPDQRKRKGSRQ